MKLRDLIKPKWQHSEPAARQAAIAAGLDETTLATIIREDEDAGVRQAAIARCTDTRLLQAVASGKVDAQEAMLRLGELLTTAAAAAAAYDAMSTEHRTRLFTALRHGAVQLELLPTALADADAETLLDLPLPAAVQTACVDTVDDKARLIALRDSHAGRNKGIHHRAEERIAAIEAEEARAAAFLAECTTLVEEWEQLAAAAYNAHLGTRTDLIEKRWASCTGGTDREVDAGLTERIKAARETIAATLEEMPKRVAAAESAADAIAAALDTRLAGQQATTASWDDLDAFCTGIDEQWAPIEHSLLETARTETIESRLEQLRAAARRYASVTAIEPANTSNKLRRQIESVDWPTSSFADPAPLLALRTRLTELEAAEAAAAAAAEQVRADFVAALEALEKTVDVGDLSAAREADRQLRKQSTDGLDKDLKARHGMAQKRLADLRDWQGFATVPKRQSLCESMEALAASECTDAPARAEAVKALQEEWKALGRSDSPVEQRLWRRFRKAADQAYAPCKRHYAALDETRQKNLADAEAMCDQLESFLNDNDWERADWPGIRKILRTSREGFQKLNDLPRRAIKPVRDRFNRVTRAISSKIQEEERTNEGRKQGLIDELTSRLAEFDGRSLSNLIEHAKDAQRRWRDIGITRYKKDKQLWADFRARCDEVFAIRETERNEAAEQEEAEIGKADKLCAELDQILNSDDVDEARCRELLRSFDAIDLPRSAKVRKRHASLRKRFDAARQAARSQQQREELEALKTCAAACTSAESNPDLLDQLNDDIERLPKPFRERMASRVAEISKGINGNLAGNAELAETLCVRAEMLASIPSPPESTQLRLRLQVDTLNDKFSRGQVDERATTDRFRELQVDWYCLGPLDSDLRSRLETRFQSAEKALGA